MANNIRYSRGVKDPCVRRPVRTSEKAFKQNDVREKARLKGIEEKAW